MVPRSAMSGPSPSAGDRVQDANFRPPPGDLRDPDNMPVQAARVLGPYKNGKTWRVILVEGTRKTNKVFRSLDEAQAVVQTLSASLSSQVHMPMDTAIGQFLAHKRRAGLRPDSMRVWQDRLRRLPLGGTVADIGPRDAQAIYDGWTEQFAPATHRHMLRSLREFFRWLVEQGQLRENPFAAMKPVGKPKVGKRQLRVDEARILIGYLSRHADEGDARCLGFLLQLTMGLRSDVRHKSDFWPLSRPPQDLDLSTFFRLADLAMDDAQLMRGVQRAGDIADDLHAIPDRQIALRVVQRHHFDQLHRDVRFPFDLSRFVDLANVRVV